MFARPPHLALAFAFGIALPVVATAQTFEYAPGSAQYRVTSKTKGAQEAMGQKQEFESSNSQLLTAPGSYASEGLSAAGCSRGRSAGV